MKARVPILLILGVFTGLAAMSCGGAKNSNPAAPGGSAPAAASAPTADDEDVDLTGGAEVSASNHISIMPWSLKDGCSDNLGIRYKLFDVTRGGRFRTRLLKIRSNSSVNIRVACFTRDKICVGATQDPPRGASWGVGINGDGKANLASCAACSSKTKRVTFLCRKKTAAGLADAFGEDDEFLDADE